jgi:RHS repeat-associated protein
MPVAVPLPAWAYSLRIELPVADEPGLTATAPALAASSTNFINNLLGNFGAFISPAKTNEKILENNYNREILENKVKDFETQLTDRQEIKKGEILSLAAMPVDKNNNPVNGLAAVWKSANPEIVQVISDSQAVARQAGETKLILSAGGRRKEFSITVSNKEVPDQMPPEPEEIKAPLTTRPLGEVPIILNEQQVEILTSPENNLGAPLGQTELSSLVTASATRTRERAGSANYSFDIPVASLPGRGSDAAVGITYNSHVWTKSEFDETRTFDFDFNSSWLAPGFSIGYGSIEGYSTYFGNGVAYLLTDPDGTRHQLIYQQAVGNCVTYESTDGSFIQTTVCGIYAAPEIKVVYPNGMRITYGAITSQGKRFPVKFTDRNGNMISISYLSGDNVGKIAYIRDTLNRYITFHYDDTTEKKLVAVTVPGYDNSSTPRQTIRFYYETLDLLPEGRFEGPNVQVNAPDTVKVLKYVYFPGTQSGFRYDYSPYFGMIYKIWQLRGMQVSTDSLTETGTVNPNSDNNWAAWTHYNYPAIALDLPPPLTDVPKYSVRKDDWQGRTTAISQINFYTEEQVTLVNGLRVGTKTITITNPDGTKNVSVATINQSAWDDGLLKETRLVTIENEQERVWTRTKMHWVQGNNQPQGRDNPRLDKIEVTNDAGQIKATSFGYDGYNNQTLIIDHDFAPENVLGTELRRVEKTYETGAHWIANRLIHLPKIIKTKFNGEYVSKVVYEYDGVDLQTYGAASITQHDPNYTSGVSEETFCYEVCPDNCLKGDGNALTPCDCPMEKICETYPIYSFYRGNVTKVTAYSNATLEETDPNALISTFKYDITGNKVEAGVNCCNEKIWSYTSNNHYAYPVSETSGDSGQLTTSATYDLNTGLIKTVTDENNQTTTFTYNPNNLRAVRTDSPNGAWMTTEYNDATYPFYVKSTTSLDAAGSVSTWSYTDGRGQNFRSRNQTANGYLSSDVEFDVIGRLSQSFNPYTVSNLADPRPGGIKVSQIMQRDGLGRMLQTKLADDTIISSSYNGLVASITDQAGKTRRQTIDALGRTTRIDEPDANGNLGNLPTFYEYDGNDNLTKITQTDGVTQERTFKYDSLSRLTHEKQIEATATLSNDGTPGSQWTGVYKYNNKGLLSESIDALGVKASFLYDGLNRTKTITYTGETAYLTPQVNYTYDEIRNDGAGNPYSNKGRLTKVQTALNAGQGTPETVHTFDYDKVGQIVNHSQAIGNQSYNLQYGYNLAGQLVAQKYPSGKVVNIAVDGIGRLATVSDAQRTYLTGASFNNQGLPSQLNLGNGTSETFTYNDRLQMKSQSLIKGVNVLQKYEYEYGQVEMTTGTVDLTKNNGQLGRIDSFIGADKQWSQRFGYDELGRLSEVREYKAGDQGQLSYKQKFDFDRFGNLYRKSAANPTSGQQNPLPFTPIETADIDKSKNRLATETVYDNAGQVVTDNKFRQMSFIYDANGRQVKASRANTPDAHSVYDALGNRVALKIYDVWRYLIYDAFGELVAEYGAQAEGPGGVKFIQRDLQGSVRAVTNNNGFVVARTDHQAFGEDIGANIGLRSIEQGYTAAKITRQGYGMTENDEATGQQHTSFRKLETKSGRWMRPDPFKGSMDQTNPQSFNRYSYVKNDPVNFIDPTGLYEACVHEAMTKFLAKLAGKSDEVANKLGQFAGGGKGGADSFKYSALNPINFFLGIFGKGPSANVHFASKAKLESEKAKFNGYLDNGQFQKAGFVLHSIEDVMGAHQGFNPPIGHAFKGTAPDRIIGDPKFLTAANEVFKLLSNNNSASLTAQQVNDLIDAIVKGCGKKADKFTITRPDIGGGGPPDPGGTFLPNYGWSNVDWAFFWLQLLSWWADQQHEQLEL